jgi:hypothetical protein
LLKSKWCVILNLVEQPPLPLNSLIEYIKNE